MEPSPLGASAVSPPGSPPPAIVPAEEHALSALSPRMLLGQVLTGGVAPLVVYELARHAGLPDSTALAVSAAPPAVAVVVEWRWRRRLNVVGAVVLAGIVLGLGALVFFHGDELLLKMRESVVTGAFGLACLITLVLPVRPAMFHLGRAMAAGADPRRVHDFDTLWEQPRARRVFTVLTLAWGLGLLLEAGLRAVFALEMSTGQFLALAPVAGWVVIGCLLYWTVLYARASRRKTEAESQAMA